MSGKKKKTDTQVTICLSKSPESGYGWFVQSSKPKLKDDYQNGAFGYETLGHLLFDLDFLNTITKFLGNADLPPEMWEIARDRESKTVPIPIEAVQRVEKWAKKQGIPITSSPEVQEKLEKEKAKKRARQVPKKRSV